MISRNVNAALARQAIKYRRIRTMLKQRMMTGVLLALAVLLGVLLLPSPWFAVVSMIVIITLGGWEWANLTGYKDENSRGIFIALLLLVAVISYTWKGMHWPLIIIGVFWWAYALMLLFNYTKEKSGLEGRSWLLPASSFLVLIPAWLSLIELHARLPLLVLYLIFLVAIADSGAYFAGKAMGLTKLAPDLSPGKTIEGFKGGLLGAGLWSLLAVWYFGLSFTNSILFILLSLVVATVSVGGDLYESLLKRQANEKDSGTLLPGHGGILDRIDGLLAALPVFTLGLLVIGGIGV
ncbi:MAG: phosphatidate cytidylyltransferase [Aquificaceae bacterium]|nr:MAG: phosphatidate cytidylyltransferase [Aquificaceae bacterium]